MFNFGPSAKTETNRPKQFKSKQYFKDNEESGLYQDFDPYTGKLKEQGRFQYGKQTGTWRVIDEDGDEIHYSYTSQRVGALCQDGTTSSATGRGACSWHGGVAQWLYQSVKSKIGGTGKYAPIQQRIEELKKEVKARFKINKNGLQFQLAILNMILDLDDKTTVSAKAVEQIKQVLKAEKNNSRAKDMQIKQLKEKLAQKQKQQIIEKQKAKQDKGKEKQEPKTQAKIPVVKNERVNQRLFENVIKQKPIQKQLPTVKQQKNPKVQQAKQIKKAEKSPNKVARIRVPAPKPKQEDEWESDNESERETTQKKLAKELSKKMFLK